MTKWMTYIVICTLRVKSKYVPTTETYEHCKIFSPYILDHMHFHIHSYPLEIIVTYKMSALILTDIWHYKMSALILTDIWHLCKSFYKRGWSATVNPVLKRPDKLDKTKVLKTFMSYLSLKCQQLWHFNIY